MTGRMFAAGVFLILAMALAISALGSYTAGAGR